MTNPRTAQEPPSDASSTSKRNPAVVDRSIATRTVQRVALRNRCTGLLATHDPSSLWPSKVLGRHPAPKDPHACPSAHWLLVPLPGEPFLVLLNHASRRALEVVGPRHKVRATEVGLREGQLWQVLPARQGQGLYVLRSKTAGTTLQQPQLKSAKARSADEASPQSLWEVIRISTDFR